MIPSFAAPMAATCKVSRPQTAYYSNRGGGSVRNGTKLFNARMSGPSFGTGKMSVLEKKAVAKQEE